MNPRIERYNTVIVGGGQAGLAIGQQLAARDIDSVILDAELRVGDTWRRRWDSLRLFTPAAFSGLPDMVFPAPPGHLPDKDEVADYLERYAERFDLPVRSNTTVRSVRRNAARFVIDTGAITFEADNVVVATGALQRPNIPLVSGRIDPSIHQLHSSEYRSPFQLPDGPVLVVGAGSSGALLALELARFRKVWLAGPDTGDLPRRILGRDLFAWIWPVMTHATRDRRFGAWLRNRAALGGDTRIGLPERALSDVGVVRVGRVTDVRDGLPMSDGNVLRPRTLLWCTGFLPDFDWIDLPVFGSDGHPRHHRGVSKDLAGLYFLGLRFQHRMTSSLIGGVGLDARFIAEQVSRRAEVNADI
ncbi:MAG: NAD(P)-binding domain-containing protein [Gemmatimonadaceae bacterium]